MSRNPHDPNKKDFGGDLVDDSPLLVQSGGPITLPLAGQRLVAKTADRTQSGRPRQHRDVLPLFVAFQYLQGQSGIIGGEATSASPRTTCKSACTRGATNPRARNCAAPSDTARFRSCPCGAR